MITKFYARNIWPAIRGGEDFVETAYANALSHDRDIAKNRDREDVPIKQILNAVAEHFDCEVSSITKAWRGRRDRNYPRWIAMKFSQDLSGQNLTVIARYFNVGNYCTISRTITRLGKVQGENGELLKSIHTISQDLTLV